MADLDNTYYGEDVVDYINEALGSEELSNESGGSASATLNDVFGDDLLDSSQSGSEWCAAVLDGLDGMEDEELDAVVKILHISDPHGSSTASTKAKEMMAVDDTINALFVTGDVTAYNGSGYTIINGLSEGLTNDFNAIGGSRLLLLPGNHDSYDNTWGQGGNPGQKKTTDFIKSFVGNNVVWGDSSTTTTGAWWHKDIQLGRNSKLRIIGIDQYEFSKVRWQQGYYTIYSQAQVDWLIGLLKDLTAKDYIIIGLHEPAVQSPAVPSGESYETYPDEYAVAMRPSGVDDTQHKFVSTGLRAFGNKRDEPDQNLMPRIIAAYMNREHLVMTYNNKNGINPVPDISIDEDFSNNRPATFLCWLGGHRHCDATYYLPNEGTGKDWSAQLMSVITAADKAVGYQMDDDLGGTGTNVSGSTSNTYTYRMNKMTFDFAAKTITIERIGAQNTVSGIVRDSVTFPFVRET